MPPTKRILDLKDSHQQSMLCYQKHKKKKKPMKKRKVTQ